MVFNHMGPIFNYFFVIPLSLIDIGLVLAETNEKNMFHIEFQKQLKTVVAYF